MQVLVDADNVEPSACGCSSACWPRSPMLRRRGRGSGCRTGPDGVAAQRADRGGGRLAGQADVVPCGGVRLRSASPSILVSGDGDFVHLAHAPPRTRARGEQPGRLRRSPAMTSRPWWTPPRRTGPDRRWLSRRARRGRGVDGCRTESSSIGTREARRARRPSILEPSRPCSRRDDPRGRGGRGRGGGACGRISRSDVSMRELHAFAERLEIPRRGFGGDHYDVPEEYVERVVEAGAHVSLRTRGRRRGSTSAGLRRRRTAAPLAAEVMLIGMMGAGKTTVGPALAHRSRVARQLRQTTPSSPRCRQAPGGRDETASQPGRAARRRGDLPTRRSSTGPARWWPAQRPPWSSGSTGGRRSVRRTSSTCVATSGPLLVATGRGLRRRALRGWTESLSEFFRQQYDAAGRWFESVADLVPAVDDDPDAVVDRIRLHSSRGIPPEPGASSGEPGRRRR